jgi:DNA-binding MarR family transcriptional regulator
VEDQIVAAIRRIIRAVDLHSRQLLDEYGLTAPQLTALRELERIGETPAGVLARAIHLSQPTLTGILDRLERRGLILRTRDGQDRRTVNVNVTPAGRDLLGRAPHLLQERFLNELEQLREWERTLMLSSLQRIAEMMEAGSLDAAPLLTSGFLGGSEPAAAKEAAVRSPKQSDDARRPPPPISHQKEVLSR